MLCTCKYLYGNQTQWKVLINQAEGWESLSFAKEFFFDYISGPRECFSGICRNTHFHDENRDAKMGKRVKLNLKTVE